MTISSRRGQWDRGSWAFRRGWFAGTTVPDHDVLDTWEKVTVAHWQARVHPALSCHLAESTTAHVLMLGDPIDLEAQSTDGAEIASKVLNLLHAGTEAATRYIAYLGGRFSALMWKGSSLVALTDCSGTLPVYWKASAGELVLSSHVHLIGEVTESALDRTALAYLPTAREMKTRGTLYIPGIRTAFQDVRPLMPNHRLEWKSSNVTHTRYYPFADTSLEPDPEVAHLQFSEAFTSHVRLLSSLGRLGFSITAGVDSRSSLVAAIPYLDSNALSWTYVFERDAPASMLTDVAAGKAIAQELGISHQEVVVGNSGPKEIIDAYARTFRYTPQMRRLPISYFSQLPRDLIEMQSMVAETGTGFYKNRDKPFSLERLCYLYCNFEFGQTPMVHQAWEEHAAFAPIQVDGPIDYHDLFYWETRVGRWGALRMQEMDLVHHLVSPFNARGVLEAMLAPDIEDRKHKQMLRRFIAEQAPRLADIALVS